MNNFEKNYPGCCIVLGVAALLAYTGAFSFFAFEGNLIGMFAVSAGPLVLYDLYNNMIKRKRNKSTNEFQKEILNGNS